MKKYWLIFIVMVLVIASSQPAMAAVRTIAPIYSTDSQTALQGRYIVVYKPGVSVSTVDQATQNVSVLGGTILFRYNTALVGYAAVLSDQAVNLIAQDPNVDYIEADQVMTISTDQNNPPSWGLDRIDQRALPLNSNYTYNFTGAGVRVYIIDTGIWITHNDFGGRASVGYDAVGGSPYGNGIDCNGHGTHVSGTVGGSSYGVAKGVSLIAVRVLDCSGVGSTSGVIAGVDWVTAHHVDPAVANMSLGGSASRSLDTAVANSINAGVTYAIAAGNSNRDACRYSPARVPAALTVGATTNTDSRASYSNYGTCLDLFAPGSSITSAWYGSNNASSTISGTSMASPHVAGVAALYLQAHPSALPADVANAVRTNATPGVVKSPGRGSPNLLLYSLIP
jgi:subtilisin family serine protease